MAAAAKYIPDDDGEYDRHVRMSAEAGRGCVRKIHQYPIFSPDWMTLVDSLKQLKRLVHLDGKMPANAKLTDAQGRNRDSEGTLWDQEQHENAIRILVEEAKVNLCLRLMNDYKKWQYNPAERTATVQQAVRDTGHSEAQLMQKCAQFEESLGLLLWKAFAHVETLQLMDIPLLIEHCIMILEAAKTMPADVDAKMQETVVLHYFSNLMKHAEALNNAELLAKAKEMRLVQLTTAHFAAHAEEYPADVVISVAEGFAAMCDNEDFQTSWPDYFTGPGGQEDPEIKNVFLSLEDRCVNAVTKENPERKKDMRPLMDFCKKLKR